MLYFNIIEPYRAWIRIFKCDVQSTKRRVIEPPTSDDRQGLSGIIDVACSSLLDSSAVVQ